MSLVENNFKFEEYFSDPFVGVYDDIINSDECEHFINIAKDKLERALVSVDSGGTISTGRTGKNAWISHDHDEITKKVGERIAKIVGIPLENAESYQIIHYGETEEYRNHYDSWEHNYSEKTLRCMKWGGARLKTALCYLNNVTEGGGTEMTKLNKIIEAKKGRMLVFENTYKDNHNRHPLSEHAGTPVINGEKYAFNLWFRECNSKQLYSEYNPDYYNNKSINNLKETTDPSVRLTNKYFDTTYKNFLNNMNNIPNIIKLNKSKEIYKINSYVDSEEINDMLSKCVFNSKDRRDCWLKLSEYPSLVKKIEDTIGIDKEFFENINIVEYRENKVHNNHFNAYDLNSEIGKKYTKNLGQRIYTITLILNDNIKINFPKIEPSFELNKGDLLVYRNVLENNIIRDDEVIRNIVCTEGDGYLANIYVRNNNGNGDELIEICEENEICT